MEGTVGLEVVEELQLDPSRVSIWSGNARAYDRLTEASTRDLIDSIKAEGRQLFPVIVRPGNAPDHPYELIAGCRRHYAISWLRQNEGDGFPLLARVMNLTDEQAFRLSDIENRARMDVSEFERARNYAWALDAIYGGRLGELASSLAISKSWLSKTVKVGRLPDELVRAFASPDDIQIKPAYELALAFDDPERAPAILRYAQVLAQIHETRAPSERALSGSEVIKTMLQKRRGRIRLREWYTDDGKLALTFKRRKPNGLTVLVHPKSGADRKELVRGFEESLEWLDWN
jgi:ParB family chromosome partitioning protein